jgi:hypothetical protein
MVLSEDDNVPKELAPTASYPPFGHRFLPRATIGRFDRVGAHGLDKTHDGGTEDRVAVEYQLPWRSVLRQRFAQLLDHRCRPRAGRDVKVHYPHDLTLGN